MLQKALAVGFAVIIFNLFFFGYSLPMLGSVAFFVLILSLQVFLVLAFFKPDLSRRYWLALVSMLLAIVAAGFSVLRASEVDQFFLGLLSLGLTVIATYLSALEHEEFGAVSELAFLPLRLLSQWLEQSARVIILVPEWVSYGWRQLTSRVPQSSVSSSTWGAVIRGLIITVPVVLVIVGLLSGADPIFSHYLREILTFNLPHIVVSVPERVLASIAVFIILTPVAMLSLRSRFRSPLLQREMGNYALELLIMVSSVALVLGLFIIIQSQYLFATVPETKLHEFGVNTLSEYVRKGFAELLLVSVITYIVSGASMVVYRMASSHKHLLRTANVILLSEMLLFIFSIFRRVMLYQVEHGLTRVRIYGSLFLIMLIGLTVVLLARQLMKGFRYWYLYEVGLVVAIILFAGLLNVDNLIATKYVPTVNDETDYVYISRLSADGVVGWVDAYQHAFEVNNEYFGHEGELDDTQAREITYAYFTIKNLQWKYYDLIQKYGDKDDRYMAGIQADLGVTPLRSKNIGEMVAFDALKDQLTYTEVYLTSVQLTELYSKLSQRQQNTMYDRSLNSPLVD
ncbi:MAG TPA: DUF4153 domain-containing protein [Patescibacteria group bacterium]